MKTLGMEVKPFGLSLNKDKAALLLKGLTALPVEQRNINYDSLIKDLETIVTLWDRRIKNQKVINSEKFKTAKG